MSKTATYRLVEDRLGKDLRRHVVALWKRGKSWNAIARDLHGRTDIAVTSETIRVWFSDLKPHLRPSAQLTSIPAESRTGGASIPVPR